LDQQKHNAALDGLRGFAAVSVVFYHIGHWLHGRALATNAGLAVDLFFCLSGYVLAMVYGERLGFKLSRGEFFRLRLIRLLPLMTLATLVSTGYVIMRAYVRHENIPTGTIGSAFILGILNVPFLNAPIVIGGRQLFPLNGPQYTLFLELFVNGVWCLSRRLNKLEVALGIALFCLPFLAHGLGGDTAKTFWLGFPRVAASFFLGVAVFHVRRRLRPAWFEPYVFWSLALIMAAIFYYPAPLTTPYELLWAGIISPLLVFTGASMKITGHVRTYALLAGELSYAIYALHYPIFCWVNGAYQASGHSPNIFVEGPLILAAVLILSYLAVKFYDEPVRAWLGRRRATKEASLRPRANGRREAIQGPR